MIKIYFKTPQINWIVEKLGWKIYRIILMKKMRSLKDYRKGKTKTAMICIISFLKSLKNLNKSLMSNKILKIK